MRKTGGYKEALPELKKVVLTGLANDDNMVELKSAYAKVNPGKDSKVYLAAWTNQFEEKYKTAIVAKMLNEQASNFKLQMLVNKNSPVKHQEILFAINKRQQSGHIRR